MTLTLTLRAEPPARVLAAPLTPERLCGLNGNAVARLTLRCGAETPAVGDLFAVSGAGTEEDVLLLVGDLRRFDGIGAGLSRSELEVRGHVGAWAGAEMSGGVLRIFGMPARGSGPPIPARAWE